MSIEAKSLIDSIINSYNPLSVSPFIGSDGLFHFLYLTYHKNTYKFYLGKHTTNNLEDGYIGSGSHFRRALNKHGKDSFIHLRLLFLESESEAYLKEAELVNEDLIRKYRDELKVCYNLRAGGLGGSAYMSQETRDKISQTLKETMARPEIKARLSLATKEAMARPDVKAKISQATKEAMARPEIKAKWREAMNKPEVKAKQSQSMKEASARPEVKAKRSQSQKEVKNRPDVKAKSMETMNRPDVKAKISQASRESQSKKELVNPSTGETKETHWRELFPLLKEGWQLTASNINLYNPKDNNRRTMVRFERPDRKIDKDKALAGLIQLLEDGWEVGSPSKDFNEIKSGGGEEIVGVQEEKEEEKGEYCERRRMWSLF